MAQDPLRINSTTSEETDHVADLDGPASSKHVYHTERQASAGLPVRLALKQQQKMPETTIHDITKKFRTAAGALQVGQLVKDEYFTLFESITAIEIMDPKMDSGFLQPGETLEESYDALTPLLPEEVIGIMDQLLSYEMAWHTGYPLSQTLFTSVYIDKLLYPEPKVFEHAQFYRGSIPDKKRPGVLLEVLRAYCLALIKCCDFVIAKITGREYFEEEDFCTHTYNRVLFVQVPLDVFQRELDTAGERLFEEDLVIDESLRMAIATRLDFRQDMLTALDLECPIERLQNYWPPILRNLTSIYETHQLGKPVPDAFSTKIQRRLASTVPPRPIVELEFKDAFEKLKQLCTDCEEATRFTTLPVDPLEYQSFLWSYASRSPPPLPYSRSYLSTILFHPNTLNTTISVPLMDLRTLLLPASPLLDPSNWTLSPPRDILMPKPPRLQLALLIDEFVERAGQNYIDFWTALGQNRCRLRRMLGHVILGWDQLWQDAAAVDEDLMRVVLDMGIQDEVFPYPLTTWVYQKKLWMMEKMILLGFEQDIYFADEFAGMYGFLGRVAGRRREILMRVQAHVEDRMATVGEQSSSSPNPQSSSSLPPQSNYTTAALTDLENTHMYLTSLLHEVTGTACVASALSSFYILCSYLHLLPSSTRPFSTEALRYELRMKPFLMLQPPEVMPWKEYVETIKPYGDYGESGGSNEGYTDLFNAIDSKLKEAKDAFAQLKRDGAAVARAEGVRGEWERDVKGWVASCVALGVAVAGVKGEMGKREGGNGKAEGGKGDGKVELGIRLDIPGIGEGKRYSEGWVVGKVVKGGK